MLERLTNNKLMSTVHRVVNPSKEKLNTSRYSIPFFMHPKPDMDLTCLDNCIDENNPKSFDDMTAGQFLEERLKEIGLKKLILRLAKPIEFGREWKASWQQVP